MKCPRCEVNGKVTFLGVWYVRQGEFYMLMTHYGCEVCKCAFTRPVSEDAYYYKKQDGSVIVRPSYVPLKDETRLFFVDYDPGFRYRLDHES